MEQSNLTKLCTRSHLELIEPAVGWSESLDIVLWNKYILRLEKGVKGMAQYDFWYFTRNLVNFRGYLPYSKMRDLIIITED